MMLLSGFLFFYAFYIMGNKVKSTLQFNYKSTTVLPNKKKTAINICFTTSCSLLGVVLMKSISI